MGALCVEHLGHDDLDGEGRGLVAARGLVICGGSRWKHMRIYVGHSCGGEASRCDGDLPDRRRIGGRGLDGVEVCALCSLRIRSTG